MYQLKQIIYKSIFIDNNQKDVVQFKAIGNVKKGDMTTISFEHDGKKMEIKFDDCQVFLKNDQSTLRLIKDRMVSNYYLLPYGEVSLKTKLLNLQYTDNHLGIKYELHDNNALISTVYITINMISLEKNS